MNNTPNKRIYIRDLMVGQVFLIPDSDTQAVVERRASVVGKTLVTYRTVEGGYRSEFVRPGMATVELPFG